MEITTQKGKSIWEGIKKELQKGFPPKIYELWIEPLRFSFDTEKKTIYICGPDRFFLSWVQDSGYLEPIQAALSKTLFKDFKTQLAIQDEPKEVQEAPKIPQHIVKLADDMMAAAKKPRQQFLEGFMPTTLCRTTFFRPVPRKELKPAGESYDHPPIETQWATLVWHGPDCGIKEEDVLVYLLNRWVQEGQRPFSLTYNQILDALGFKKSKQGLHYTTSYRAVKEHIDRLAKVNFLLSIKKGSPELTSGGRFHVLSYTWDDKKKVFTFIIHEEFGKIVGRGYITGLRGRDLLEKDISKALHRFICSHGTEGHYPLFDVAQAINMDITRPTATIRRMIRAAMAEMKKTGFLTPKSKIVNDIVHWYLAAPVLSGPALLEKVKKIGQ